jgi:hypothetical protein
LKLNALPWLSPEMDYDSPSPVIAIVRLITIPEAEHSRMYTPARTSTVVNASALSTVLIDLHGTTAVLMPSTSCPFIASTMTLPGRRCSSALTLTRAAATCSNFNQLHHCLVWSWLFSFGGGFSFDGWFNFNPRTLADLNTLRNTVY